MNEQQIKAAGDAIRASLDRLAITYNLGPMELAFCLAHELSERVRAEALAERMAIQQIQSAMIEDEDAAVNAIVDSDLDMSTHNSVLCCKKHNMMGRVVGECRGGAVAFPVHGVASGPTENEVAGG